MTALPRRTYRDPLEQILEAEAETCKGCRWRDRRVQLLPVEGMVFVCNNPLRPQVLADKRCDDYEENA